MAQPTISVIIPAYNHERFVGPAIESILAQTVNEWELIVIDDGSTDRTPAVIQRYDDPRIHFYRQPNQDAFNTINRGLDLAQGRFISILNSDDRYLPNRLERLLERQKRTGAACLFSDVRPIDDAGHVIPYPEIYWHLWHERNREFFLACGDLYTAFLRGNLLISTSNLFMTREAIRTVGHFAALRYLHDYDYIFRMMLAFPKHVFYVHDEILMEYRIHGTNTLSQGAITAREQDVQLIRTYLLAALPENLRAKGQTGSDRLVELERELAAVRQQLLVSRWARIKKRVFNALMPKK